MNTYIFCDLRTYVINAKVFAYDFIWINLRYVVYTTNVKKALVFFLLNLHEHLVYTKTFALDLFIFYCHLKCWIVCLKKYDNVVLLLFNLWIWVFNGLWKHVFLFLFNNFKCFAVDIHHVDLSVNLTMRTFFFYYCLKCWN